MKCRACTALLFGIAMFLGCGPTLQVKTDFDHHATFQQYRSFRMGEGKVIERGAVTDNTIVKDRVNTALRNGLMTRGLQPGWQRIHRAVRRRRAHVTELEASVSARIGMWGAYRGISGHGHPEGRDRPCVC